MHTVQNSEFFHENVSTKLYFIPYVLCKFIILSTFETSKFKF
jgi:hypothetical protein